MVKNIQFKNSIILGCLLGHYCHALGSHRPPTTARSIRRTNAFMFELKASRRSFFVDTMLVVAAAGTSIIAAPQLANAEDGGDFFKDAQERAAARSAARAANRAAKGKSKSEPFFRNAADPNEQTVSGGNGDGDDNEFVFKAKVQEIQDGIAERKERAIALDKEETIRMEENEFIQELKARSAANKDKYLQESKQVDKLSTKQFSAQYKKPSYTGVRRSDGSIKMMLSDEVEELEKANKIKVEYETGVTKDGNEFTDYSKKRLVLIDEESEPTKSSISENEAIQTMADGAID